jgi:hypothetical protein
VSTASTPHHIGANEITELLAWCRRLTAAGPDADPTERTAYLAAKTDLLAVIIDHPDPHPSHHDGGGGGQEQR